jgi:hypothetical protein
LYLDKVINFKGVVKMIEFKKAIKKLPNGISYDPMEHTTIKDLLFIVQHELDLINEEPEHYEHMTDLEVFRLKKKCISFINTFNN